MKINIIDWIKVGFVLGLFQGYSIMGNAQNTELYKEKYRPQYHFSPRKGWIGDPSGFIYYQNKYHMYWWGKAESEDLVHYKQVIPNNDSVFSCMRGAPENIAYFTGSILIDKNNTAGFGKNAYVAAYTAFEKDTKKQAQGISYSGDGLTFDYYQGNPVLDIESTEFRDPTVFYYEPTKKWIMVVAKALEKKVKFYSSSDLKKWEWMSDFGPAGNEERAWECPDLFQLSVDDNPLNKKWVLVVSINWNKEQYFIGNFDGKEFKLIENHPKEALYVDKGLDYYASRTFRDYDNTLKTVSTMGWVSTWDYAPHVPSTYGKGFWSVPRNLALKTFPEGLRMTQIPVKQLEQLRYDEISFQHTLEMGVHRLPQFSPEENCYEMDVCFDVSSKNVFGFNLCVGEGRKVVISYDTESNSLLIDRMNCTDASIPGFGRVAFAKVAPENNQLKMHIYVDKSSIELFVNEGKDVFTLLTYPSENQTGIEVFALQVGTSMKFKGWKLKPSSPY